MCHTFLNFMWEDNFWNTTVFYAVYLLFLLLLMRNVIKMDILSNITDFFCNLHRFIIVLGLLLDLKVYYVPKCYF